MLEKCRGKGALLHCWWECKLVTATTENHMEVTLKIKNRVVLWSSNSTPGHMAGYVHPYNHSSTGHNSQDMATT